MTPVEYTAYVLAACFAIFLVPGQVFFLSVNEGMRGIRSGVMMPLGVLTAESLLLIALVVGFVIILQHILGVLKVLGAGLLIWLGASAIHSGIKGSASSSWQFVGTPLLGAFS